MKAWVFTRVADIFLFGVKSVLGLALLSAVLAVGLVGCISSSGVSSSGAERASPPSPAQMTIVPTVQPLQGSGHDLVIDAVSVDDSTLGKNQVFTLSATVRNTASQAITIARRLRYYRSSDAAIGVSDTEISAEADSIESLAAFASTEETASLIAPLTVGTYYYGACVDLADATAECSVGIQVMVAVSSDVYFDGVPAMSIAKPDAGEAFSLTVSVGNRGEIAAPATTQVRFYLSNDSTLDPSDTVIGTVSIGALGISSSTTVTRLLNAPVTPGQYYIGACVEGVEYDNNPTDNCSAGVSVVIASSLVRFFLGTTIPDQSYVAGLAIANLILPEAICDISCRDGGVSYSIVESLPQGLDFNSSNRVLSGVPDSVGGLVILTYTATDPLGNTATVLFSITVLPPPDVHVQVAANGSDSSITIGVGAELVLWAVVASQGGGGTSATTLQWFESADATIDKATDLLLSETAVSALVVGSSEQVVTRWNTQTQGGWYYGACVIRVLGEADVTNNCSAALRVWVKGVEAVPAFPVGVPAPSSYVQGVPIENLVLPRASGGNGALSYSYSGTLPSGLSLQDGVISGTAVETGSFPLIYKAIDADENTAGSDAATLNFTIHVEADTVPVLTASLSIENHPAYSVSEHALSFTASAAIVPLRLPMADGGNGELTPQVLFGTLSGMRFDYPTRTISGTPILPTGVTKKTFRILYKEEDADGDMTILEINAIVEVRNTVPTFGTATIPSAAYHWEEDVFPRTQLPAATGGDGLLRYRIIGELPAHVSFDASSRALSGVVIAPGVYDLAYVVEDGDVDNDASDTDELNFTITVLDLAPTFSSTAIADKMYTEYEEITSVVLSQASGGERGLVYSLTGLPPGLAFNADSRVLSGTPTGIGVYEVGYRVGDQDSNTAASDEAMVAFTITVNEEIPDYSLRVGEYFSVTLFRSGNNGGPYYYSLCGAIPDGLVFNAATWSLSGTPINATLGRPIPLVYQLRNDTEGCNSISQPAGNALVTRKSFTVFVQGSVVVSAPVFPSTISSYYEVIVGTDITPIALPMATVGNQASGMNLVYEVLGVLPAGLRFDDQTRQISGIPTQAVAGTASAYIYSVRNPATNKTSTIEFSLTVRQDSAPIFINEIITRTYILNTPIADQMLPRGYHGDGTLVYRLEGALPTGLAVNNGVLSGIPMTVPLGGSVSLIYRVSDSDFNTADSDTDTVQLTIRIDATDTAPHFSGQRLQLVYDHGAPVSEQLPSATGGNGALRYSLQGTLPAGLNVDATHQRISGSAVGTGNFSLVYRVFDTDENSAHVDSADLYIDIQVGDDAPTFGSGHIDSRTHSLGLPITSIALPAATGGNGALIYSLSQLPSGLIYREQVLPGALPENILRTIEGVPTGTVGTFDITWTARDSDTYTAPTDEAELTFSITLYPQLSFGDSSVDYLTFYKDDQGIRKLLPAATGGYGKRSYSLLGAPVGFILGQDTDGDGTNELLASPTVAGSFGVTYAVADQDERTPAVTSALTFEVVERPSPPDLLITSISASDTSLAIEQVFTLTATVINRVPEDKQGTAARAQLKFYRSMDSSVPIIRPEGIEVGIRIPAIELAPSDSFILSSTPLVPPKYTSGYLPGSSRTYYYGACVEVVSGESDTTNNCSQAIAITVSGVTP